MARKRQNGHYCWACDRWRANEKFSGQGHARHLCKDCARLGKEELAYRQAIRNLERLATWEGIIPRKRRGQFRKYLAHADERVRARAREMEAADAVARAEQRRYRDLDQLGYGAADDDIVVKADSSSDAAFEDTTEIPF